MERSTSGQEFYLSIIHDGGAEGTRTPDLLRAREALSQLSYSPFTVLPIFLQLTIKGSGGR